MTTHGRPAVLARASTDVHERTTICQRYSESNTASSLEHGVALEHAPTRITTTLYDGLATLQDVAPADDDTPVVATAADLDADGPTHLGPRSGSGANAREEVMHYVVSEHDRP